MLGPTGEINPEPITGVIPYVLSGEWTLLPTNNNIGPIFLLYSQQFPIIFNFA